MEEFVINIEETIKFIDDRSGKIAKYSDNLRDAIKNIDAYLEPKFQMAGLIYRDSVPFFDGTDRRYYLKIKKMNNGRWAITYFEEDYYDSYWIGDAPRVLLKYVINRLPIFLEEYAKELCERTENYKEISEIANKMFLDLKKE